MILEVSGWHPSQTMDGQASKPLPVPLTALSPPPLGDGLSVLLGGLQQEAGGGGIPSPLPPCTQKNPVT